MVNVYGYTERFYAAMRILKVSAEILMDVHERHSAYVQFAQYFIQVTGAST